MDYLPENRLTQLNFNSIFQNSQLDKVIHIIDLA